MASSYITLYTTERGYSVDIQTGLFINNEFVGGSSQIELINPADGKPILKVEAAGEKEVNDAVNAAEKAFKEVWSKSTPGYRRDLINRLADLLARDEEEIAQLETLNVGKAISVSRYVDAKMLPEFMRYYAGWADKIQGKLDPALATGNTIVIKSSEVTPLTAIKIAALTKEAGFPPGVINIITGYGDTAGEILSRHRKVGKITFTGSLKIGRLIMKAAAESNLKKVSLELGGKSPNIIFGDANVDDAVKWAHRGIFFSQGQVCTAGSRIYVQDNIYDEFIAKFKAFSEQTSIGHPLEEATFHGPQVSKVQYDRVMGYINSGKEQEPTIFTDVTEDMTIMKEEIFGPVVCIAKFKTIDEAVEVANNTIYGLAAAIFSQDINTCLSVSERVQAGTVWVNCINLFHANTPFGGFKESGIGREGGEYVLSDYTQVKAVKINLGMKI
ncbi:hypothetical protein Unana1_04421 [Umbelopsis nana]